jgi:hypothetical protein
MALPSFSGRFSGRDTPLYAGYASLAAGIRLYMPVWPILLYSDQTQLWSIDIKSTIFLISF